MSASDTAGDSRRETGVTPHANDSSDARLGTAGDTLASSEAFLHSVLNASSDCIKVVEADGRLTYMNANGLCAMEIDDFSEVRDLPWWSLWPAEARDRVRQAMEAARSGQPARFEAFCPTAKGTPRWWDVSVAPVVAPSGGVTRIVSISRDISERKQVEQDLAESEARFRAVQETSVDGFMVLESVRDEVGRILDFRWTYSNAAAARIVGKPHGWFPGRRLLEEMPGNREDGLFDAYVRVVETGEPWTREFIYRHEGLDLFMRAVVIKVEDGFAVSFADLSERRRIEVALQESEARLEAIVDSIDQMIWSTRPDGFHDYYNRRWYEFTGVPAGSTDGEGWNGMFHPDDQERARARWDHSLKTGEPYHIEYRLRHRSGQYRWVIGRAQAVRDEAGRITRWYGTCTDVHDLKTAEEQRELIARELSHRIKNIFAVVTSLVALTSRHDDAAKPFATTLRARLDALARAHDYVRPHSSDSRPEPLHETFQGLLRLLLEPYESSGGTVGSEGASGRCFVIDGDDTPIGTRAATAVALIFHEAATNAVKYGALSRESGFVRVTGRCSDGLYVVTWQERGGPPIAAAPSRQGFGSVLAHRSATTQLGARIEHDWAPEGLTFRLILPLADLSR